MASGLVANGQDNRYREILAGQWIDEESEFRGISPRVVKREETVWVEESSVDEDAPTNLLTERHVFITPSDRKFNRDIRDFGNHLDDMKEDGAVIFHEQEVAGKKIHRSFSDEREIVMILALGMTQSGKTGVMVSTIEHFVKGDSPIPIENIFIVTGLSSIEWKEQTKARVPAEMHPNIFHRPQLKREFMEKVQGKKDVLILIDEVQIACKENQTIASALEGSGLLEMQVLLANDIKIVEFSATPNGTLYDSDKWNSHSSKVKVLPGAGYTSCIDLLESERVKACEPLTAEHFVEVEHTYEKIKETIDGFSTPRYHIIRTPSGDKQGQVITYFNRYFKLPYKKFDMTEGGSDINQILSTAPEKHTFVFIKEKARCAKTFVKTYIGIWYERYANTMMDDVVTQGLLGRATGYDDNGDSVIFTHIESIHKYQELWDTNFEAEVEWLSSTTMANGEHDTSSIGTFNRKVKNGGVYVIPEEKKKYSWTSFEEILPTHRIDELVLEYQGDGTPKTMGEWFKQHSGQGQHNPFKESKLVKGGGFAKPSEQRIGSNAPVTEEKLRSKIDAWKKKGDPWTLESFGAPKKTTPSALREWVAKMDIKALDNPINKDIRRAYVCYKSFSDGEEKKPVLYIRTLTHK